MKREESKKQPNIGLKIVRTAKFMGTVVFMSGIVYAALLKGGLDNVKKNK